MKKYWNGLWALFFVMGLQACNNADRNVRDEKDTINRVETRTAGTNLDGDGKVFALSAATGGMMEVEAAGVAIKKSRNKLVKDFASLMLKDHGAANQELKTIAEAKGLNLPQTLPAEMAHHITELNGLEDRAFDVQYIRMMIGDHQRTVQLFTEGANLADPELKAFATKTLPVIRQHNEKAVEIGKHLNVTNANNGDDVLGISPSKIEKK
ncbi:DUF4142 domain-containing protein [Pedobacter africanus]|uniref:Putative membrane protein n=1 Tax=Pedobacter africanus TaxID=151894 RepID=A0A1W2CVV9_9SPHI|nr:DUF4142 domain-containing protein [Pedobacter africanus]SMC89365.1 putative membrane protein [Pedobacter africanus]